MTAWRRESLPLAAADKIDKLRLRAAFAAPAGAPEPWRSLSPR